jgi:hypothetical protein
MFTTVKKLYDVMLRLLSLDRRLDEIKINQGLILSELKRHKDSFVLSDYEFKVFSQWGEDGILQFLTMNIDIRNKTFIEFGVEDFLESNCRFLLMKDVWQGFVIDGSSRNIDRLRASYFYWRYPLSAKAAFITRENVCELLDESCFDRDLGILSVDIDGVDYFVLERLQEWSPRILIVEYNGVFGMKNPVSVPYQSDFQRTQQHYSNLYYGASLSAFVHLLQGRGYALVGINSVGSNAFFVRRELLNDVVREVSIEGCYRTSCFRESRDVRGRLTFLSGSDRRDPISHLPLVNVVTGNSLYVRDLHD